MPCDSATPRVVGGPLQDSDCIFEMLYTSKGHIQKDISIKEQPYLLILSIRGVPGPLGLRLV